MVSDIAAAEDTVAVEDTAEEEGKPWEADGRFRH
jgi:hypothetical protein